MFVTSISCFNLFSNLTNTWNVTLYIKLIRSKNYVKVLRQSWVLQLGSHHSLNFSIYFLFSLLLHSKDRIKLRDHRFILFAAWGLCIPVFSEYVINIFVFAFLCLWQERLSNLHSYKDPKCHYMPFLYLRQIDGPNRRCKVNICRKAFSLA